MRSLSIPIPDKADFSKLGTKAKERALDVADAGKASAGHVTHAASTAASRIDEGKLDRLNLRTHRLVSKARKLRADYTELCESGVGADAETQVETEVLFTMLEDLLSDHDTAFPEEVDES